MEDLFKDISFTAESWGQTITRYFKKLLLAQAIYDLES